ncbi:MAG: squalene synthase HpnC [Burkholderiaceae bacterium]|nr:squalene synthase HpnC [Burkholderiaceae bacterium]
MSVNHYENFPVASILLPAKLRSSVATIYAFARSADDLADEGDARPEERITSLEIYESELNKLKQNETTQSSLFIALGKVIKDQKLPFEPFYALLSAFKQDVTTKRYQTFNDLLDYCARSANPVGQIMLGLYKETSEQNRKQSDEICSALQLINFWQDVAIDWQKGRIYVPLEDLKKYDVDEAQISNSIVSEQWRALMRFQTMRARTILLDGSPLCKRLPGRIGWELRLVVQGGLRILERIDQCDGDVFRQRPKLNWKDWLMMIWRAIRM